MDDEPEKTEEKAEDIDQDLEDVAGDITPQHRGTFGGRLRPRGRRYR